MHLFLCRYSLQGASVNCSGGRVVSASSGVVFRALELRSTSNLKAETLQITLAKLKYLECRQIFQLIRFLKCIQVSKKKQKDLLVEYEFI